MKDMLGHDLQIGDYVVFFNNIYQIQYLCPTNRDHGHVGIKIHPASRTSRTVVKYSRDMVRVSAEDVSQMPKQ